MRNFIIVIISIAALFLYGCSNTGKESLSGYSPPDVYIDVDNEKYKTKLGTYCWKGDCVDTFGPAELLKDKEPIQVEAGATVTLEMDYNPKPNDVYLTRIVDNKEFTVPIQDHKFKAPTEKGIYYYSYGVWWLDEKDKNMSHGDAFYAFVLAVK